MPALNLKLEQYEGPLDLLLSLIQKHKLDIFDIPIASLTDQYLAYIDSMEEYNMELSSDFIYMASELLYIKSRMLLPVSPVEEDPRKPLIDALLEYGRAKATAEFLKLQGEMFYDRYVKEPDEIEGPVTYERQHSIDLLIQAFEELNKRVPISEHRVELFEKLKTEKYFTVEEKTVFTIRFLFDEKPHSFSSMFDTCRTIGETVATFLALLSLVRNGRVNVVRNGEDFDNSQIDLILIKHREEET